VESGERYVGEWEAGKPKWVQSLGLEGSPPPDIMADMQAKVEQALEVCCERSWIAFRVFWLPPIVCVAPWSRHG
jgi:hypothetical protein